MLRRLGKGLLYVGPGAVVLGLFAAGHMTIRPETDRLMSYRVENGLIADPDPAADPPADPQAAVDPEAQAVKLDAEGRFIPPAYRYFSFTIPFSANIGTTRRLFSMEVSVSVFGSPFRGDAIVLRLQEMEAQLRPVVLEEIQGMSEEEIRDPAMRNTLALRIRDALNATLEALGEDIQLDSTVITSVILT